MVSAVSHSAPAPAVQQTAPPAKHKPAPQAAAAAPAAAPSTNKVDIKA